MSNMPPTTRPPMRGTPKREVVVGELSTIRQATLPIAAAIVSILFPAVIYLAFNLGPPATRGWGVPIATDIAFALGILALLGTRVPIGLKIFLTALAIVDDLGAVTITASKLGILIGSLLAGVVGFWVLRTSPIPALVSTPVDDPSTDPQPDPRPRS